MEVKFLHFCRFYLHFFVSLLFPSFFLFFENTSSYFLPSFLLSSTDKNFVDCSQPLVSFFTPEEINTVLKFLRCSFMRCIHYFSFTGMLFLFQILPPEILSRIFLASIFSGKFTIVQNKSKNQYEKACCVKENIIFQK